MDEKEKEETRQWAYLCGMVMELITDASMMEYRIKKYQEPRRFQIEGIEKTIAWFEEELLPRIVWAVPEIKKEIVKYKERHGTK